jgi:hypothetical protein
VQFVVGKAGTAGELKAVYQARGATSEVGDLSILALPDSFDELARQQNSTELERGTVVCLGVAGLVDPSSARPAVPKPKSSAFSALILISL